jgi:outer membrane protein OmpA-like peptidoglycan-associated protein
MQTHFSFLPARYWLLSGLLLSSASWAQTPVTGSNVQPLSSGDLHRLQPGVLPIPVQDYRQPVMDSAAKKADDQTVVTFLAKRKDFIPEGLRYQRIHFDYDKAEIEQEFDDIIQQHAEFMKKDPRVKLTLEGHVDERGEDDYNHRLGKKRAQAIKNRLVRLGVTESRIKVESHVGETSRLVFQSNEWAWRMNRRVEFVYSL